MLDQGAVHQDHELDEEDFRIELVAKPIPAGGLFQLVHMVEQVMAGARGLVHDAGCFPGLLEALGEVNATATFFQPSFQKIRGDIDDNAFIGQGAVFVFPVDDGAMDLAC